jgi:hypothetical protein
MFWAECLAAVAMRAQAKVRFGKHLTHSSAIIPPMEPPTTRKRLSIPRAVTSSAWALAISAMVMTGKDRP